MPLLYFQPVNTRVVAFLSGAFGEADPLLPLRLNHRDMDHFTRAFHEKFDGLRILQFLKTSQESDPMTDEENLWNFMEQCYPPAELAAMQIEPASFSFADSPTGELEKIRMFLYRKETEARLTSALP